MLLEIKAITVKVFKLKQMNKSGFNFKSFFSPIKRIKYNQNNI